MIKAAGIMFVTPDAEALFLQRAPGGDHVGQWCWPGGTTKRGETPEEAATRETREEIGRLPAGVRQVWMTSTGEVAFTTFIQYISKKFEPKLNGEHTGYVWAPIAQPPQPLHPGCKLALDKLGMNELDIARAIRDGQLPSPQHYENITLFAMRISGTGVSYRHKFKEFVYRRPEIYLTDEFLARCNGLPVIWEHPPKDMLDTKEFLKRIIGTVFLPYIKGDEVWGIVKIWDREAVKLMEDDQLSTSPAVVFRDPDVNTNIRVAGEKVLAEGDPSLVDHLAAVERGVWDKGGPATGIDISGVADAAIDALLTRVRTQQTQQRMLKLLCRFR